MRRLLIVSVVTAFAAVCAISGGSAAAATDVLCQATEEACTPANTYGSGTELHAVSIEGGGVKKPTLTTESFFGENLACEATLSAKTKTTATPEAEVAAASLTWSNCTGGTASTVTGGTIQIHRDAEHNATLTGKGFVIKAVQTGITCYYSGILEGTITGGNPAVIDVTTTIQKLNTEPHKSSFLCPSEPVWHAYLQITSPKPLYAVAEEA